MRRVERIVHLEKNYVSSKHITTKEVMSSFSAILWFFYALGIPLFAKTRSRSILKRILWLLPELLFHGIFLCLTLMYISLYVTQSKNRKVNFATVSFVLCGTILRYAIYFSRKKISRFIQRLAKFQPAVLGHRTLRLVRIGVVTSCVWIIFDLTLISALALETALHQDESRKTHVGDMFFGLVEDDDESALVKFLTATSIFGYTVCAFAHLDCFAILFCVLAFFVKKHFDKLTSVAASGGCSVSQLLQRYGRLDDLVLKMDETFSLIIFLAFVSTANSIYYNSVAFIYRTLGDALANYLGTCMSLVVNTGIVASMSNVASDMHDSSQDIEPFLSRLKDRDGMFINKLWFTMKMKQDIYLTVWRIQPLTKSFIIAYLGTIFTYSLLIDSMQGS